MINDKGNLARHESLCSKFGRYIQDGKCLFCCKSYRLRYMYRHIVSAHRDQIDTEVLQRSDEESSKCKNCGKKYQMAMQRKYHETICFKHSQWCSLVLKKLLNIFWKRLNLLVLMYHGFMHVKYFIRSKWKSTHLTFINCFGCLLFFQ